MRAELLWWYWHARNRFGRLPMPSLLLVECIHPQFTKCKNKVTYCTNCGQAFKC